MYEFSPNLHNTLKRRAEVSEKLHRDAGGEHNLLTLAVTVLDS